MTPPPPRHPRRPPRRGTERGGGCGPGGRGRGGKAAGRGGPPRARRAGATAPPLPPCAHHLVILWRSSGKEHPIPALLLRPHLPRAMRRRYLAFSHTHRIKNRIWQVSPPPPLPSPRRAWCEAPALRPLAARARACVVRGSLGDCINALVRDPIRGFVRGSVASFAALSAQAVAVLSRHVPPSDGGPALGRIVDALRGDERKSVRFYAEVRIPRRPLLFRPLPSAFITTFSVSALPPSFSVPPQPCSPPRVSSA